MKSEDGMFQNLAHNALRIAVGLMFFTHGAQKLLGWFGGFGDGGTAELLSRFGVAGVLETFGGLAIIFGLFTRPVAFVLSGQMAVAYFWIHAGRGGIWWWENRGEVVALYAFVFLFLSAVGGGNLSLDRWLKQRRTSPEPSGA
jgi:putative oxidoreductase